MVTKYAILISMLKGKRSVICLWIYPQDLLEIYRKLSEMIGFWMYPLFEDIGSNMSNVPKKRVRSWIMKYLLSLEPLGVIWASGIFIACHESHNPYIYILLLKIVIFQSYIKLPKGRWKQCGSAISSKSYIDMDISPCMPIDFFSGFQRWMPILICYK